MLKVVECAEVGSYRRRVRLVIIEDQMMFREALKALCERDLKHQVVGESETGEAGVELVLRLAPDVVLLDLSLPDIDGFAVAERLTAGGSLSRILILSSHRDDYTLFRVEQANVHGFVDKNSNTKGVLADALRAVEAGHLYYSSAFQAMRVARRKNPMAFNKMLTEWERHLLALIGLGWSDEEIAAYVNLSSRTIQTHRSNLLQKLNISGTPKLIRFAIENGFTQVPPKGTHPATDD